MKLCKNISLTLIGVLLFGTAITIPAFSVVDCSTIPPAAQEAAGCSNSNTNAIPDILTNILNSIILISGLIAVIFIIIGGVKYMTSTGDAGKVKQAKDTILYAVIGLIICALAFAIVNWTIGILNDSGKVQEQSAAIQLPANKSLHF